jgi:hypothetical protein
VSQWADRCYFALWVQREDASYLIASWWIGLTTRFTVQGMGGDEVGYSSVYNLTLADNPYLTAVRTHPEDGTRTYRFYELHVYVDLAWRADAVYACAGDYERRPVFDEGAVLYAGPSNRGDHYRRLSDQPSPLDDHVLSVTDTRQGLATTPHASSEDVSGSMHAAIALFGDPVREDARATTVQEHATSTLTRNAFTPLHLSCLPTLVLSCVYLARLSRRCFAAAPRSIDPTSRRLGIRSSVPSQDVQPSPIHPFLPNM